MPRRHILSTRTAQDFLRTGDIAGLIAFRAEQFGGARMELDAERTFDEQIDDLTAQMRTIVDEARGDSNRAMTDEEVTRYEALEADLLAVESSRDAHEATLARERAVAEREAARAARPGARVISEPSTYSGRNGSPSYFRDLIGMQRGDTGSRDRLVRNNVEVSRSGDSTRALSSDVATAGGDFVPPLWMVDQFVKLARPGRPFADALPHFDVPAGTDSINIPRVKTGTTVAKQTGQNTAVSQTDLTTDSISASVFTIAGGQTVSMQLIEQSPINIDTVVLGDLAADYAQKFDSALLNDATTGLDAVAANGNAAVKLDYAGTFSASSFYSKLAGAFAGVNANRYAPADLIVMHPRRWAALTSASDTTGRPLFVTNGAAFNPMGIWGDGLAPQGVVGSILDTPVLIDPSVTTSKALDTGTGEDVVYVLRRNDQMVFESSLKAGAFQETYANQLSWFFRLYAYGAYTFGRYDNSIATISGSALSAPTF